MRHKNLNSKLIIICLLLLSFILNGCDKKPQNLEQEMLKQRNIAFDKSDYKKFVGGEDILNFDTVFTDLDPTITSGDNSTIFVSGGDIYKFDCDQLLFNQQNCVKVGSLPSTGKVLYLHSLDVNGTEFDVVFADKSRYRVGAPSNNGPYIANKSQYGMIYFEHTYCWQSEKELKEISGFQDKITYFDGKRLVVADGKLYSADAMQVEGSFPKVYSYDKNHGFIINETDCSKLVSEEKIITIYNENILVTDKGFYQIVYADIPDMLLTQDEQCINSDGTVSKYLPKYNGGNKYRLEKLELLSKYYDDILTFTYRYVITKDYTMISLSEVIGNDYEAHEIKIPEDVYEKINARY
ncbi:MAG: hypothetical protein Q4C64_05905 [Erysipelotrichia bacterium]|nr:hypothetical protein [Erysipelotrichia bacterium]